MEHYAVPRSTQREKHAERAERLSAIRVQLDAILKGNIRILSLEDLTRQMIAVTDLLCQMDQDIASLQATQEGGPSPITAGP